MPRTAAGTVYLIKILGTDYTEKAITERISGRRTRPAKKAPKQQCGSVSLLIDIQNSIKAQENRGYEQWAKIHNLKQTARTLNFLTEHKIEQYTELTAKIAEITATGEQAADSLKAVEKKLSDMAVLIKNVTTQSPPMTPTARQRTGADTGRRISRRLSCMKQRQGR